ncbi:hypothetical protein DPMN_034369 [Dreissena polymorpha]|uniref:Malonyl-CoA:ACP transacylase (MAT) domain-containing protein n=1 Tax=Dreissena polymorpha TaxID=45954 RepID=A0A9D4M5J9_DREPO|nr:hypothetical protein DPMN_034369 [Dreissena polymorpha]
MTIIKTNNNETPGMTWEDARATCPEQVLPACHNAMETVTVSGPAAMVERFVSGLCERGVFTREVRCAGVAFHSPCMKSVVPLLRKHLEQVSHRGSQHYSKLMICQYYGLIFKLYAPTECEALGIALVCLFVCMHVCPKVCVFKSFEIMSVLCSNCNC